MRVPYLNSRLLYRCNGCGSWRYQTLDQAPCRACHLLHLRHTMKAHA